MLEIKEVFKHTLRCGANRIILIHNHPSGNPAPSVEDEPTMQKIKRNGGLFRNRVHRSSNCWYIVFI